MNPQLYDDCVHFCWKCKKVGMLLDIGDQWEGTMTHKDCGWRHVYTNYIRRYLGGQQPEHDGSDLSI